MLLGRILHATARQRKVLLRMIPFLYNIGFLAVA